MLVAFRSPVIAVKAIVLNLLSVAAAYGVLVLVFQHGYGSDFLRLHPDRRDRPCGAAAPLRDPVRPSRWTTTCSCSAASVGCSARRDHRRGRCDEASSRRRVVVTSAAIVMVGVFAVFATLSMLMFKQFGVGLATAILIDATIVRGVLLPASMKLLGDWNWYLPWLEWLPRFDVSESESPARPSRPLSPPRRRWLPLRAAGAAAARPDGIRCAPDRDRCARGPGHDRHL